LRAFEKKVEDKIAPQGLTKDDIGADPDLPKKYDLGRIEEVRVPGPVLPNERVKIGEAPNGPPQKLPPPPGFADAKGEEGNAPAAAAIAAALKWLAGKQAIDGHWSLDGKRNDDVAATSLALLPFLAAGETHKAIGKTRLYAKNVDRGLRWLILKQNADGRIGGDALSQALATFALCEAYGLTADPILKGPAQRAVNALVKIQKENGGWDVPKEAGPTAAQGVWHVCALKSAHLSGLAVPNATLTGVSRFLDKLDKDDANPALAALAARLLSRQYTGWGPRNQAIIDGTAQLAKHAPDAKIKDLEYYLFATMVLFHMGGERWDAWNPKMRDLLIANQDRGADAQQRDLKGSWAPAGDPLTESGGRLVATALATLTLEVHQRRLPLYRRELVAPDKN
jgi:hypothetical protein